MPCVALLIVIPPNSIPPHLLGRVIDRPIDVVVCFGGIALLIKNPGFLYKIPDF